MQFGFCDRILDLLLCDSTQYLFLQEGLLLIVVFPYYFKTLNCVSSVVSSLAKFKFFLGITRCIFCATPASREHHSREERLNTSW